MNWIYKNHELKTSGCYNMNFLFNNGKFYIMDNHLAAAWCWLQKIDTSKRYGLFHIDRHYDLLNNLTDDFIAENRSELINKDFFFYLSLKDNMNNQAIRYDNYIDAFNKLHPNLLQQIYYATHKDGTDQNGTSLEHINTYEPNLRELDTNINYWLTECHKDIDQWIVNIDLDFFFTGEDGECSQFITRKYIKNICKEIKNSLPKIDVVTIAISPEFCNGWGNAFNILRVITTELDIYMPYKYKRYKKHSFLF